MRDIQLTYRVNQLCREDTCSNLLCNRPHESVGDSQADVLTQAEQQGWNIQTVDAAIRATASAYLSPLRALHLAAGAREPGGRFSQAKRLAADFVGIDKDELHYEETLD